MSLLYTVSLAVYVAKLSSEIFTLPLVDALPDALLQPLTVISYVAPDIRFEHFHEHFAVFVPVDVCVTVNEEMVGVGSSVQYVAVSVTPELIPCMLEITHFTVYFVLAFNPDSVVVGEVVIPLLIVVVLLSVEPTYHLTVLFVPL